jgi:glycosyltransferase involved in cell wall biosynthesis
MTAEEDFGITPVECMASGRPVIAFGRGGARDSVVPGVTGVFFDEQTSASLSGAVEAMESFLAHFDPQAAIDQAGLFAPEQFDRKILELVESA